jgi:hypothetical protein
MFLHLPELSPEVVQIIPGVGFIFCKLHQPSVIYLKYYYAKSF